jgi:hypothetical protein
MAIATQQQMIAAHRMVKFAFKELQNYFALAVCQATAITENRLALQ